MTLPGWLLAIFEGEYFVLALGFVVFTISYPILTRGDWRRSPAGRILMGLSGSCSVLLLLSILRLFLPDTPWRVYASALVLGVLIVVVIWLNGLLFSRQLAARARRKDQAKREDQRL